MSIEKIANGLGSIVKIIVYGFILLVFGAIFWVFNNNGSNPNEKESVEISKIDQKTIKQESVVETKTTLKEQKNELPASTSLESKINVEVTQITGENYNELAKAYSGIGLNINVSNNSNQVIQGIKGNINIVDAFGDVVGTFIFKDDATIKPGETKKHELVYGINIFDTQLQKIMDLTKWTTTFEAEKILVE